MDSKAFAKRILCHENLQFENTSPTSCENHRLGQTPTPKFQKVSKCKIGRKMSKDAGVFETRLLVPKEKAPLTGNKYGVAISWDRHGNKVVDCDIQVEH
eukprot:1660084-Amphidinium_carterae.1